MHSPKGGMPPNPFTTLSTSESMPLAIRGSQATLSPAKGAPVAATVWQLAQLRC